LTWLNYQVFPKGLLPKVLELSVTLCRKALLMDGLLPQILSVGQACFKSWDLETFSCK